MLRMCVLLRVLRYVCICVLSVVCVSFAMVCYVVYARYVLSVCLCLLGMYDMYVVII